jgi:hypothetical protein
MTDNNSVAARTTPAVLAGGDGILATRETVLTPKAIQAGSLLQQRVLFAITNGCPHRGTLE